MTKPIKWLVCPAKTQISLGIRPVWSRVFTVRMMKAWTISYPLIAQWRLWSDWVDAQADLSLHWVHMPVCWFCHVTAYYPCIACVNLQLKNSEKRGASEARNIWTLYIKQQVEVVHYLVRGFAVCNVMSLYFPHTKPQQTVQRTC